MKKHSSSKILLAIIAIVVMSGGLFTQIYAKDLLPRKINVKDIKVPDGYKIEAIVDNLSVPTTAIFDGDDLLVAESGWQDTAKARVLRVKKDGTSATIAQEGLNGPVTGLLMYQGQLYISHKGKVSILEKNGQLRDIVTGLPSNGDHQNNNIVLGPDNKIYIGQGTTTNAGVVGEDNYIFGWLQESPMAHDIPCKDITLNGQNFKSNNPLTTDKNDTVMTGAYHSFGTPAKENEVIPGNVKCSGSILRFNPDGSQLEMYAWGLRNPFGLEFDKNGELWATYHGADVRGSRNIYKDPDYFIHVSQDAWYGWPEYFDGQPVTESRFKDPTKPQPTFLWKDHPQLTMPDMTIESHSGANGFAFSPGGQFGYEGDAFIALYGSYSIVAAGTDASFPGFKVVRVDMATKKASDFVVNTLPGPAYLNLQGGLNRPSEIIFNSDSSMYIVDWGASTIGLEGLKYVPGSGVIWRVYKDDMKAVRPSGPISVAQAPIPENQRKADVHNVPELYSELSPQIAILTFIFGVIVITGIYLVIKIRNKKN